MVQMTASIPVDIIMEMLDLTELPASCRFTSVSKIEIEECEVDQDEIDDAATDEDPEIIDPDLTDLRDGLDALHGGDVAMARILLDRAFSAHSSETRQTIESALRPRPARATSR